VKEGIAESGWSAARTHEAVRARAANTKQENAFFNPGEDDRERNGDKRASIRCGKIAWCDEDRVTKLAGVAMERR
jgi:hypothetical protein